MKSRRTAENQAMQLHDYKLHMSWIVKFPSSTAQDARIPGFRNFWILYSSIPVLEEDEDKS